MALCRQTEIPRPLSPMETGGTRKRRRRDNDEDVGLPLARSLPGSIEGDASDDGKILQADDLG
jgi:hypothetical protein